MAWTGNYKQILYTTNTEFSDTFDYLNGPFLINANSSCRDVFIESYEMVKEAPTDEEQLIINTETMFKLAKGKTLEDAEIWRLMNGN